MKILAYGTLREHDYNFKRIAATCGEQAITRLSTISLKGYQLHDLGYYPCATINPNSSIICEILEVNQKAFYLIDRMELGAGYQKTIVNIPQHGDCVLYTMKACREPVILSGDWTVVCTR